MITDDCVFGAAARGIARVAADAGDAGAAIGRAAAGDGLGVAGGIADTVGVSRCTGVCGMVGSVADDVAIGVRLAGGSAVSGGKEADVTARGTAPVGIARGGVVISSVGADDA